jgi:beta-glucanase (GH16 family)
VDGCTDPLATNYNPDATVDDGSCNTAVPSTLTITTTVCDAASSVAMTGPWWGWDPAAGPVASDNGDGSWTFTFDPAPTDNMEYLLVVDGVQEDLVAANKASDDWSCTPITDYWSYANRQWTVGSGNVVNTYGTCGNCDDLVDTPARIDRPELDDKWHLQIECIDGLQNCWANGEKQHYTDRLENAYVSGGHLHIVAKKEEEKYESQGVKRSYTSARLNSKYDFKYGTVKVRAKLPKKSGLWPAIWTLGSNIPEKGVHDFVRTTKVNWPACGEIDIMEQYGTQNFVGSAMHGPSSPVITTAADDNGIPWNTLELSPSVDEFHVYSMEWTAAGITFKVDDVASKTVTAPLDKTNWPFDHKHFLLLNVAVEGITHKTGAIAGDFVSGEMVVDYVRIYGENGDLNWSDEFGISVSDCPGLKEAFQANCDCGVEYTSFVSLASVVPASDCSGLKKAYKENCDCSQ